MRKIALIWFVCLSGLFILESPEIYAQEVTSFYVGASLSNSWSQLDDAHTKDMFIVNVGVDFDDSIGLKFRGGLILNEYFTAEGIMEYITPFKAVIHTTNHKYESKVDVLTVGANAKCTLPVKEHFVPYGIFGLGIMNTYEKISGPTYTKETDWGFGSRLAIGADFIYEHNYSFGIELEHVLGLGNVDHVQYTNFSIGAAYRF